MFQNSSTSSSDLRGYLVALACFCLLLVSSVAVFSAVSMRSGTMDLGFALLLKHQEDKLASAQKIDTVFVGDSSLGNSIDAALFSDLTQHPSINLALTGRFGYAGSTNMALRAARDLGAKNIIIMQSVEIASRPPGALGNAFTGDQRDRFSPGNIGSYIDFIISEVAFRASIKGLSRKLRGKQRDQVIVDDYVAQTEPLSLQQAIKETSPLLTSAAAIQEDAVLELKELAQSCKVLSLNCIFVHGPLLEYRCVRWKPYIEAVAASVTQMELTLANNGKPYCFPAEKLGDSGDHVAPQYKQEATRLYANTLLSLLRN